MKKTEKIMEILNIKEIADKYPHQVSGGQQQRCACARALVNNSRLILPMNRQGLSMPAIQKN